MCNLLIGYMKKKGNVSTARQQAALDLCLGWLASFMYLDDPFQHLMYTPRGAGRYLPAAKSCGVQCSHMDFHSMKNPPSGNFLIMAVAWRSTVYMFKGSSVYILSLNCLEDAFKCPDIGRDQYSSRFRIFR